MMREFFDLSKKNDDAGVEELVESHKFLLIHEAINTTDSFGNSPIMIASQRNWSEVIIHLQFNQYCDVNHQNFFGSSALMCSASHGHLDALRVLCNNSKIGKQPDAFQYTILNRNSKYQINRSLPCSSCPHLLAKNRNQFSKPIWPNGIDESSTSWQIRIN